MVYVPGVVAVAPTIAVTDVRNTVLADDRMTEGETAVILATPMGGLYDDIEFEWEVLSGGGSLELPRTIQPE